MIIAAIFTSDPITASRSEPTTHGNLHGLGALLGIPSFPVAATLISLSLARDQGWSAARRSLLWMAAPDLDRPPGVNLQRGRHAAAGNGEFGPDVLIGWPNRLLVLTYSAWLMVVAWQAIRAGSRDYPPRRAKPMAVRTSRPTGSGSITRPTARASRSCSFTAGPLPPGLESSHLPAFIEHFRSSPRQSRSRQNRQPGWPSSATARWQMTWPL